MVRVRKKVWWQGAQKKNSERARWTGPKEEECEDVVNHEGGKRSNDLTKTASPLVPPYTRKEKKSRAVLDKKIITR